MTAPDMNPLIDNLGGQRFVMTIGAGVVHTLLLIFGYIDQQVYSFLTGGTVIAFITAGTYQDVMANKVAGPAK